jgi:hypothetical protein
MTNVAAFFASQPGITQATAKSAFLPNLAKTNVTFPDDYKQTFVKYLTINFPATRQVRHYYANKAAIDAAKANKPLPAGSYLFAEVYAAKLDANKQPVMGKDGFFRRISCCSSPRCRAARAGERTAPTCCATRTGTTPCSAPTSSTGRRTRPSASVATSRSTT